MLLAFLIGSSWVSFVLFFIGFHSYQGKFNPANTVDTDPYFIYTVLAPLYIGLFSMFAICLSEWTSLSRRLSFFIIGIISATIVYGVITSCNIYQFTKERYLEQYGRLLIYHFITYSVIVANIFEFMA